ncbi:hypothetical protein PENSPDRAFT_12835 [Peniophora sp. CONT]|nr:hypothetical protein PENSPDRAFT_12835 [Peniophora sp. CONT]
MDGPLVVRWTPPLRSYSRTIPRCSSLSFCFPFTLRLLCSLTTLLIVSPHFSSLPPSRNHRRSSSVLLCQQLRLSFIQPHLSHPSLTFLLLDCVVYPISSPFILGYTFLLRAQVHSAPSHLYSYVSVRGSTI